MIGKFSALSLEDNFYEIQDIFDERQEGTYWDFAHTSEDGNRLVAEVMIEKLKNLVKPHTLSASSTSLTACFLARIHS